VRKWTEGGGGEKREKQARMVAEFQRGGYHNSTVPVKEYLEVIEKMGDPPLRSGQVGGQAGENQKVTTENRGRKGDWRAGKG
jgi:hypothetical protein